MGAEIRRQNDQQNKMMASLANITASLSDFSRRLQPDSPTNSASTVSPRKSLAKHSVRMETLEADYDEPPAATGGIRRPPPPPPDKSSVNSSPKRPSILRLPAAPPPPHDEHDEEEVEYFSFRPPTSAPPYTPMWDTVSSSRGAATSLGAVTSSMGAAASSLGAATSSLGAAAISGC